MTFRLTVAYTIKVGKMKSESFRFVVPMALPFSPIVTHTYLVVTLIILEPVKALLQSQRWFRRTESLFMSIGGAVKYKRWHDACMQAVRILLYLKVDAVPYAVRICSSSVSSIISSSTMIEFSKQDKTPDGIDGLIDNVVFFRFIC